MTSEDFSQTLASADAEQIADWLGQFEDALKQYRTEHIIPPEDEALLKEAEQKVHFLSQQMYAVAVGLVINDAQASIEKIKQGTEDAKTAVQTITDIKKVIAIAAGVIKIGVSIMSQDIGGIIGGLGQIVDAIAS